jgi:hypothetical protein
MSAKAWILYDGRAEAMDTDDCQVLEFAGTSRRAVSSCLWHWRNTDGVLVEYDSDGHNLTNERKIGHTRQGSSALLAQCSFAANGGEPKPPRRAT